jgi:hypothetical protein
MNDTVLFVLNYFRKEAFCALKEAIMTAHEASDNVCLQHALAWLYKLSDENKVCLFHNLFVKYLTYALPLLLCVCVYIL